ncbi:MAG: hypothetical protein V1686_00990 [Patescibacteria group bacterium]
MTHESIEFSKVPDSENVRKFLDPFKIEEGMKSGALNDVKIKRSSGEIESGWEIIDFDFKSGDVVACKKEGDDLLRKRVQLQNLREWN